MNRALYLGLPSAALAIGSTAASAHPGDHSSLGWASLAMHVSEPGHIVFIALIVLVAMLGFRFERRAERRARERSTP
jgi:hypothetical protein